MAAGARAAAAAEVAAPARLRPVVYYAPPTAAGQSVRQLNLSNPCQTHGPPYEVSLNF